MEKIKIPSPSAILGSVPTIPPAGAPKVPVPTQDAAPTQTATSVPPTANRPKQSKSRNGCITCKTKRLKCDETKPTCLQCKKRKVECGGYRRDFKWRPFAENSIASRNAVPKGRKVTSVLSAGKSAFKPTASTENNPIATKVPPSSPIGSVDTYQSSSTQDAFSGHSSQSPATQESLPVSVEQLFRHPFTGNLDEDAFNPPLEVIMQQHQSPGLPSILFPVSQSQEQHALTATSLACLPKLDNFSFEALLEGDGDEIEEIVRHPDPCIAPGIVGSSDVVAPPDQITVGPSLLRDPVFNPGSPEMLVLHFDRSTCGILSVKDGAHENPWRTLVWPLAKDNPALYHAIFSLAAFHSSKENNALRVHGVDHMRQSIAYMVQDIQNMRADTALATSLALAFADTWDQNTRTCIQHLKGAKALVAQVVGFGLQGGTYGDDLARVRFLYNTWLYMDVIARLTSLEEHGEQGMDVLFFQLPDNSMHEIDPLMGCATTLFPLINQVARLVQRVRKTESNSISLISQAIELKRQVEQWEPPDWFEPPEDPTSEVQHSIQTAQAYRWATLLYLHQAVPEIPSEGASKLAKRVLILLATVPPSSRTTIIQMFPLLIAGCESAQEEDRNWVLNRWNAIQSRLMLGSIDRCIDVVREVWARRDASEAEKQLRDQARPANRSGNIFAEPFGNGGTPYSGRGLTGGSRRASAMSPLENIEFEKTVRGKSHWVYVMQEWGWEG